MRYRRPTRYRFKRRGGRTRFLVFLSCVAAAVAAAVIFIWILPAVRSTQANPASPSAEPGVQATPVLDFIGETAEPSASESAQESGEASATRTASTETDGIAFLGNSQIGDLYLAGSMPEADYFYKVGLNVRSAFDTPAEDGTVPILEELKGHNYSDILLLFGMNEVGWPAEDVFYEYYAEIIQTAHEYCPDAQIYVISIMPMSKSVSDEGKSTGATQEHTNELNQGLKEICEENDAIFLNVAPDLMNSEGYLPNEASSDGIHMNRKYLDLWMDKIKEKIGYTESGDGTES